MPINDQISEALIDKHLAYYGTGFSTDLVRIVIYFCRLSLISLLVPGQTGLVLVEDAMMRRCITLGESRWENKVKCILRL